MNKEKFLYYIFFNFKISAKMSTRYQQSLKFEIVCLRYF